MLILKKFIFTLLFFHLFNFWLKECKSALVGNCVYDNTTHTCYPLKYIPDVPYKNTEEKQYVGIIFPCIFGFRIFFFFLFWENKKKEKRIIFHFFFNRVFIFGRFGYCHHFDQKKIFKEFWKKLWLWKFWPFF
jgi:hypothetical protein